MMLQTLVFGELGVVPEVFEFVKIARFLVKNVNYRIEVIETDPQCIALPLGVGGCGGGFAFQALVNVISDGFDLRIAVALANDEVIGGRIFQRAHIQFNDFLPLDVPNGIDDEVVDFLRRMCRDVGIVR